MSLSDADMLQSLLSAKTSREKLRCQEWFTANGERFDYLMRLVLYDQNWRICQAAVPVLEHVARTKALLLESWWPDMIEVLEKKDQVPARRRNLTRTLQFAHIPRAYLGRIVDWCFRWIADPQEAVAVRVFSMTVVYNATLREPDLSEELRIILEEHLPYGTAGFRSRGQKILQQLSKLDT